MKDEVQAGWSPYHYAYNDPVNGSDGSGVFTQTEGRGSTGVDDLFAVGDEARRQTGGYGGNNDPLYNWGWMSYGGYGAQGTYFAGGLGVEAHPMSGGEFSRRVDVTVPVRISTGDPATALTPSFYWGQTTISLDMSYSAQYASNFQTGGIVDFGRVWRGGGGSSGGSSGKESFPGYSYNDYSDLSKPQLFLAILLDKAAEQFGIKDIAALALALLGIPMLETRGKFGGAISGTPPVSKAASKLISKQLPFRLPTVVGGFAIKDGKLLWKPLALRMTNILGRFIGRAVPFIGWGVLAYDVGMTFYHTTDTYQRK